MMNDLYTKNSVLRVAVGGVAAAAVLFGIVLWLTAAGMFGAATLFEDPARVLVAGLVLIGVGGATLTWVLPRRKPAASLETEWRARIERVLLFLPGAAVLIATAALGGASGVLTQTVLPGGDQLVLLGLSVRTFQPAPALVQMLTWIPYYAITLFYFVGVVLVFIPLGQYTGKCMRAFAPIPAYSLNLAGSLVGALLFALVSLL